MSSKKLIVRESLALKYRPKTLADLVGQDRIVTRINGIVKTLNVPNAILLTGPTGGGKTTTARIIARTLNCETLDNCGTCASCVAMDKEMHRDYMEINAADARGIDDTRNIINQAKFKPSMGNLRIIVIDEAQQLTPQAAQALLKSLEEPHAHTLWILCSMEPEKLHKAIFNRCTHMRIEAVGKEKMVARFKTILKAEKLKIADELLFLLAEYSEGQMRLGLQNLDAARQFLMANDDLDAEALSDGLKAEIESTDDVHMVNILSGIWLGNTKQVVRAICGVEDAYRMSMRLVDTQTYLITKIMCVDHPNIWATPHMREVLAKVEEKYGKFKKPSSVMALIANDLLTILNKLRAELGTFTVAARPTLMQHCIDGTDLIKEAFAK